MSDGAAIGLAVVLLAINAFIWPVVAWLLARRAAAPLAAEHRNLIVDAGAGGFWPLVIGTLLVFPMTFLAHRALARFVVSGDDPETDITELSREKFGEGKGLLVTALYALCFLPILPIYGVAVTNSVSSLLENQLGWTGVPRWLLSLVLVGLLMSVVVASQKVMLWVAQVVVYPLIVMLAMAVFAMLFGTRRTSAAEHNRGLVLAARR